MTVPPYDLALGTIFRDETRYLKEWLCYHMLVGVKHFYLLCCDDESDLPGVNKVLRPFVDAGIVTWATHRDRRPNWQLDGWKRMLDQWGGQCEWLCFTDADAFLYSVEGQPIPDVVRQVVRPDTGILAVYLSTFGSSKLLTQPDLQLESFVWRSRLEAPPNWTANYILNPSRIKPATIQHGYARALDGFLITDTDGTDLTNWKGKRQGPLDRLRLNHYSIRSRADWDRKLSRGWAWCPWDDPNHSISDHKFKMLDRNDEEDRGMDRYVPEVRRLMAEFS